MDCRRVDFTVLREKIGTSKVFLNDEELIRRKVAVEVLVTELAVWGGFF